MRRILTTVIALAIAYCVTGNAHAGADVNLVFKGPFASTDAAAIAANRDLVIPGDGTGASKFKALRAANPSLPIGAYVKVGGVRTTDAEWVAAQEWLWRQPSGEPYTQSQNGWAFGQIQKFANSWAATVVIPHLHAALDPMPAGTVGWIMVDNGLYQDPSLFAPGVPPDYDAKLYHDATLTILLRIREAFPDKLIIVNGIQGGAPAGLRGEALGSTSPNYADGVWAECWYADCAGKPRSASRFATNQALLMGLISAGKLTVVDEAGLAPYSPLWREAFGVWLATTGRVGKWGNAYFNLSATPFEGWER